MLNATLDAIRDALTNVTGFIQFLGFDIPEPGNDARQGVSGPDDQTFSYNPVENVNESGMPRNGRESSGISISIGDENDDGSITFDDYHEERRRAFETGDPWDPFNR